MIALTTYGNNLHLIISEVTNMSKQKTKMSELKKNDGTEKTRLANVTNWEMRFGFKAASQFLPAG